MLAHHHRGVDRLAQPVGDVDRLTLHHDDELVAAEAGQHVVLAQHRAQPLGHDLEELVADLVAEAVVDRLEVVEVDEQDGDLAHLGRGQPIVEQVHQVRAVGETGQLVVACRVAQLLRRATLLGDVLDVGDRQHHAVVLGGRDARAGPHVLAIAAAVALVDPVRIDDAELEPRPVWLGGAHVVGMRELAERATHEIVDVATQHLGQRLVGVDDATVVEPHQRHAGRRRLERLLEATPGLVEGTRLLLPLGHVAQPDDQPLLVVDDMVTRHVERHLDDHLAMPGGVHRHQQRVDVVPLEAALDGRPEPDLIVVAGLVDEVGLDELAPGQVEHLQRGGVGRQHDAGGIDQQHRFGQLVEQATDLGLGLFDGGQPAAHALVLAAQVPHAEGERGDGDDADDHDRLVSPNAHATRLRHRRP